MVLLTHASVLLVLPGFLVLFWPHGRQVLAVGRLQELIVGPARVVAER